MKCNCGKSHDKDHPHFKRTKKLTDSGFPTHSSGYPNAHREANKAEKKKFGKKAFNALEHYVKGAKNHELIGKNTKSGKIEVEKKIPRRFKDEIAFHEKVENKILRKKK